MILNSTSKKLILALMLIGFMSSVSADFYYNQGGGLSGDGFSQDSFFSFPEYDSQVEIATELVAPFIFISVLLQFALSKALSFILANNKDDPLNDNRVLWGLPRGTYTRDDSVDVSRYSMIMSLTITASLIPTPYWDWISGIMRLIGVGTAAALVAGIIIVIYLMAR